MSVRKGLVCLLCLGIAAGMVAAAGPKPPPGDPQATAVKLVDLLAAGDFAAAVESFDEALAAALPEAKLKEVWTTLNAQAGPFRKRTGTRETKEAGHRVIYVACRFERGVLETKVVFDDARRIAGLFFVPPPAASAYAPPEYDRPGAYAEREVRIGRGDFILPGTLSTPRGSGAVPGIVLVHGSGPLDRDESIGPNRPFRDLACGLASRGVAVLRYDKRTLVHAPRMQSDLAALTLHEETVADAVEAVRLLRRSPRVDGSRVFVLGHSLGGVALPRIALLEPGIAGYVLLAAPSRPLLDSYVEQMAYLSGLDGVVTQEEQERLDSLRRQVERARAPGAASETGAADLPLGLSRAYWDDLARHDPSEAARLLKGPVLVLQGGRDYQVTSADFAGWRRVMAGRSDVTFRMYPSLNHLFLEGEGRPDPAEYEVAGHVARGVVEDVASWVKSPRI